MMKEMDQEPTSRLRRRSFFEGIESEGSTSEKTTSNNDTDMATTALICDLLNSDSETYGGSTSLLKQGKLSPDMIYGAKTSIEDHTLLLRAINASRRQRMLKLLEGMWCRIGTGLQLQRLWHCYHRSINWIKRWREDSSVLVTYRVYPTQWLLYASVSLVLLQIIIYWKYQAVAFDLHIHECVFKKRLLASADLMQPHTVSNTHTQPSATALNFLQRQFELQRSPGPRQTGQARLPWTCLAVVPVGDDSAVAKATELSFLWPRSQVVAVNAFSQLASRVHVAVGASSFDRGTKVQIAGTGVFAALFPLSVMRPELFAARFPDLVLVTTEFALHQMLKFRQGRQEEHDHRERAGVNARNTLPVDPDTFSLAGSYFGVYLLKTTVPDIYNRHIRKKWDEFLHVVVVDDADEKKQFTEELLSAWVAHPTWPMLHVRFYRSLALCRSFQRILSSMLKNYAANDNATEAAEHIADQNIPVEDQAESLAKKQRKMSSSRILNVDLVCEEEANTPQEIVRLKNMIGMHLFPVPPELEKYEVTLLESLAVGAVTVTYNTPIMQEWVQDNSGLCVGTFNYKSPIAPGLMSDNKQTEVDAIAQDIPGGENGHAGQGSTDGKPIVMLPSVHVTLSDIEHAVETLTLLDRVSRVAAGRSARVHYLRMRTHHMSAVAALDAAACEGDGDELVETQNEIGEHRRKKVEVETLRAFLY